jgi:ABC-type transporter Mla subunit MlaD
MAEITIRISDRYLKFAGILLVGSALIWVNFHLWSSGFYQPKYHLRMYVAEAVNLPIGARVRVDGFNVGTVEAESPAEQSASPERRIEIILRVEKRDQGLIRSDSVAKLETEGLFGNRYIAIERGFNGAPLPNGSEIIAMPSRTLNSGDVLNSVSKWVDHMKTEKNKTGDDSIRPIKPFPNVPR